MTESEAVSGLMSSVGDIRGIISAVSAVIALTIFLIAANSMSMMIRERLAVTWQCCARSASIHGMWRACYSANAR